MVHVAAKRPLEQNRANVDECWSKEEVVRQIWQGANHRDKGLETWGAISTGMRSAGMGGGIGGFMRFDDRKKRVDVVDEYLAWWALGPAANDHEAVGRKATAIAVDICAGASDVDAGRIALNEPSQRCSQTHGGTSFIWGAYCAGA